MTKLVTLNGKNEQEILNSILDNEIIVYEDIQGSKTWINWNGNSFTIKAKSLNSEPINLIDLAMQNYYNHVVDYFNNLSDRVKSLLNKKWWFCFEYFPDNQPANIEYSKVPKNKLVLTTINKSGKFNFNFEELVEYSRLFDVDVIPVIYQGKFTEDIIEAIKYFINTSEDDLEFVFGDKSFTFFFYKILNPNIENSFLMNKGDFQKNIEKLIVKCDDVEISFELLNPLYKKLNYENSTEFVEIYTLILINFLNFCQSIDLKDIKIKGEKKDEIYINLICRIYNIYLESCKRDLLDFDFTIPEFFDKEKFKINTELIPNKKTKEYIKESSKLEYIFKVILGSFNKKKKKPIGIFTENTVIIFNNFVDFINNYIDTSLNKMRETELNKAGLLDFGDFFDISYDVDGEGDVYPDVYDEFGKEQIDDKKKKGKDGKYIIGDIDDMKKK